ncbi:MAG: hypothetical protein M3518_07475 [Actinomycetota bacterium]|nr:hypothetical protein [Actinomycetota bacterium]
MINYDGKYTVRKYSDAKKMIAVVLAALLVLLSLAVGLASPAKAQTVQPEGLAKTGPIDPSNGFPYWYEDQSGTRLDLCLDPDPVTSKCLLPFEMPESWTLDQGISFPDKAGGEDGNGRGEGGEHGPNHQ